MSVLKLRSSQDSKFMIICSKKTIQVCYKFQAKKCEHPLVESKIDNKLGDFEGLLKARPFSSKKIDLQNIFLFQDCQYSIIIHYEQSKQISFNKLKNLQNQKKMILAQSAYERTGIPLLRQIFVSLQIKSNQIISRISLWARTLELEGCINYRKAIEGLKKYIKPTQLRSALVLSNP